MSRAAGRLVNSYRGFSCPQTLIKRQLTGGNTNRTLFGLLGQNRRRTLYIVGGLTFATTLVGPVVYTNVADWIGSRSNRSLNQESSFQSSVVRFVPSDVLNKLVISRSVSGPNLLPDRIILLQYQSCPFCCKVRTFLDFYGLPYDIVEVNPVVRQQLRFSAYRKVPIVLVQQKDDQSTERDKKLLQLNDSSAIISILGTYLARQNSSSVSKKPERLEDIARSYHELVFETADGRKEKHGLANQYFLLLGDQLSETEYQKMGDELMEERKWRKWADDVLVHTLSPNVYNTPTEALQAFNHFSVVGQWETNFNPFERLLVIYVGALAMYFVGKHLKRKHNLKQEVRQSMYDACNHFLKQKGKQRRFMGYEKPNLSDLAVYGVLSSIEGCRAFEDLLQETSIGKWYNDVKQQVRLHSGFQAQTASLTV